MKLGLLARRRHAWLVAAGLATFLVAQPAQAACEGISNAFAYNECLAKQAPQRGHRAPRVTGDPEASVVERGSRRSRRGAFAGQSEAGVSISRRNGRSNAVIDPWGGVRNSGGTRSGRRR